jgi:hypothetical protein
LELKIEKVNNVLSIPNEWDKLANCYYQRKQFLLHSQNWNRCEQRYYLAFERNRLVAGAVVYTLKLNLFTFSKITLPLKMKITGVPCSVSCPGLIGSTGNALKLYEYICSLENGLNLALNLKNTTGIARNMIVGNTLPVIIFNRSYSSWDDYLNNIRSDYRRRIHLIEEKSRELKFSSGSCFEFTKEMYNQYIQVYEKSNAKLELLDFKFFKYLPKDFCLTRITIMNDLVGWFITLKADNRLYFFFGGLEYYLNEKYAIYLRVLIEIIQQGIELGVESIDLGQTAEVPKMRLGGESNPLYLISFHKNYPVRSLLRSSIKLLEYKNKFSNYHVFKD